MACKTVKKTVQIPRDIIARVVARMVKANDELLALLLSGNNVNYTDSIVCAPHGDADCAVPKTVVIDGHVIELDDELIHAIETSAQDTVSKINLDKINASSMRTCSCCADSVHERHCERLDCSHYLCKECFTGMMPEYEPGDFIELCRHRCPLCRDPIKYTIDAPWTGKINELLESPEEHMEYRICGHEGCSCIFGEPLDCGATRDNLPDMCIAHRPKEVETKQCPECGREIEKDGGCNHMTCVCGHEFCWVCLTRWPDEYSEEPEVDEAVLAHVGQYFNCPFADE
jgi:hypothetical protein